MIEQPSIRQSHLSKAAHLVFIYLHETRCIGEVFGVGFIHISFSCLGIHNFKSLQQINKKRLSCRRTCFNP